jgi:hypothetical protein
MVFVLSAMLIAILVRRIDWTKCKVEDGENDKEEE